MTKRRTRYKMYIPAIYWDAEAGSDDIYWKAEVLAYSRTEAVEKANLPDLSTTRSHVKYVSVYVGENQPGRLIPIRVETGR